MKRISTFAPVDIFGRTFFCMKTLEKRLLHHKRIDFSTGFAVNVLLFGKIEPKKYQKNTNTENKKKTRKQILCFFPSTKHTSLIHQKGYTTHRGPSKIDTQKSLRLKKTSRFLTTPNWMLGRSMSQSTFNLFDCWRCTIWFDDFAFLRFSEE